MYKWTKYIFDAHQNEDAAQSPNLPAPAGPGDFTEIKFISSIEAESILGSGIGADMKAGTNFQLSVFTIVSIWDLHNKASSFPEQYNLLNALRNAELWSPETRLLSHIQISVIR
jgi:hypothetical protein